MKHLIVKPQGGLANRIRVLESACGYAARSGARLTVIWEKNFVLNAPFSVCFLPLDKARVIDADYNGDSLTDKFRRSIFNLAEAAGRALFTTKKLNDPDIYPVLDNELPGEKAKAIFDELARDNKGIFIETCLPFYPVDSGFRVRIQTSIREKATRLLQNCSPVIGIHIRRTDHADSIEKSPLQKFIDEINSEIEKRPTVSCYLSTDADDVVHQLQERFGDRIITGVSVRARDSEEGIVSALLDLYCLSRCEKILGSYKSSFSERAALIGNIPLQIVST